MTSNSDSIASTVTTATPSVSITNSIPSVTSSSCTNAADPIPTLIKFISSSGSCPSCDHGRRRESCLEMCRTINSITPAMSAYLTESNDLPDAFMLFSLYDKLRTLEMTFQSIVVSHLDSQIVESKLGDNIEADLARKNVKLLFQNFEVTLKRIREIAPTLSIARPPQQQHSACGHVHGIPPN